MFLQRLRGTNPIVEAAVLENLASLSPLLSDADYAQVVRAFSDVSRSTALSAEDPRVVKSAVLTAQTRLAQSIDNRPERAELYLRELLELFVSRGLQLQQQPEHRPTLIAHMFALLPVIEAVVNVRDYTPHLNPDEDTVTMFRNTWFLIVLLGFLTSNDTTNWQRNSLKRIAAKTPCLVRGAAADYIQNDLEYNSILRKDLAATHGVRPSVPESDIAADSLYSRKTMFEASSAPLSLSTPAPFGHSRTLNPP